jgi:ABC-type multidrug transport system permease subunit
MVIIRGILLKGSGIFELWIDVVYLMVFFLVVFNLAIRRLKKGAILQTR